LVHRRRLMHPADDGLEVIDVEGPRIEVPVPADDIERMMVEDDLVCRLLLEKKNREISRLVDRLAESWAANVALGVGSAFDELAEFVAIALGPPDVSSAFEYQKLGLVISIEVEPIPVQ